VVVRAAGAAFVAGSASPLAPDGGGVWG